MDTILLLFTLQCALGGLDNLWHHELEVDLPHRPGATFELLLHAARQFVYAAILLAAGWSRWQGAWCVALLALLVVEVGITLCDFVVEDRTRRLPASERVLHTLLALNYGAVLACWAPLLGDWLRAPTALIAQRHGAWSWLMALFAAGALLWGLRDLLAALRLRRPAWQLRPIQAGSTSQPRTVLISGGTGFIGRALARRLVERGDKVIVLTRRLHHGWDLFGPAVELIQSQRELDADRRIDAIVNLAGASIAAGPWTARRRRKLVGSRIGVTAELTQLVARLQQRPEVLVNASAIGYYGERGEDALDEGAAPQQRFISELCRRWERAAAGVEHWGVRVCLLRIGLVLGQDGGVLPPMARAARLGGGTVLGDGRQWLSWIHLDDLLRQILWLIERRDLSGAFNAVAPAPLRQREFAVALSQQCGTRLRLRVPAWLLRILAGEMSDLFLISQKVLPRRAEAAGFCYRQARLEQALADLLPSGSAASAAAPPLGGSPR